MVIDKDFVYGRFPKTDHDVHLLEDYRKHLPGVPALTDETIIPSLVDTYLPIYEGTKATGEETAVLTQFGFMALSIDDGFMNDFYRPVCRLLLKANLADSLSTGNRLRLLRSNLIEFALLGCLEAQEVLSRLTHLFGEDDEYIEAIVNTRCPNLRRFLNAHSGAGRGVNDGDKVSSYEQALKEVKSGGKATHWIWYVFPQMAGIRGTHSQPALFYGINGRLEAFQYINHPTLRRRLVEISEAVLNNSRSVYEIFGNDAMKVRACVRLFASVSDIPIFKMIIDKYRW